MDDMTSLILKKLDDLEKKIDEMAKQQAEESEELPF